MNKQLLKTLVTAVTLTVLATGSLTANATGMNENKPEKLNQKEIVKKKGMNENNPAKGKLKAEDLKRKTPDNLINKEPAKGMLVPAVQASKATANKGKARHKPAPKSKKDVQRSKGDTTVID